ncbi:nucleoside diphosphate kinase, mitochondrial-like isoform X2 [Rhineura floridana]|uniref:nucleoside diphosphate kinase, mitochondrial-like isoform X2 n=1 Tax=Rhineura floridana TaxID=261503 RepID=UPI002AC84BBF|nr:nucleoside diphosphate kinase, mitochondrial-like isoform X2 [Rhineura floridana]
MGFLQRCVGRSRCLLLLEGQRSLGSLPSSDRGQQYSTGVAGLQERTLIAVKPDGVQRRLVGDVIKRFEKRGFKLVGLKLLQANEGILTEHYHELRRKPFYQEVIQYMTSGPVVAMERGPCQRLRGDGPEGDQPVVPQQRADRLGLLQSQNHV